MKVSPPLSLKLTVPFLMVLFAATLSGISILYNLPRAERSIEQSERELMYHKLSRLQGTLEYMLRRGDKEGARRELVELAANPQDAFVVLLDENDHVLIAMRQGWVGLPVGQVLPAFDLGQARQATKQHRATVNLNADKQALLGYIGVNLGMVAGKMRPSRMGYLFLKRDLSSVKATARARIYNQSLYWSVLIAALAALLGLLFHLLLTRRVARLAEAAERLAAGEQNVRTGLTGSDELASLGRAFDAMAEQIAETQTRLAHELIERKNALQALREVARGVSEARGDQFFETLVRSLAVAIRVECAFIGLLFGPHKIRTCALYTRGTLVDNVTYELNGRPCAKVVGQKFRFYPQRVRQLFPHDSRLDELNSESYAALPLFGAQGEPLGLVAILDSRPLRHPVLLKSILKILADRVSGELERREQERALRESQERMERALDGGGIGLWDMDVASRRMVFDKRWAEFLGYPPGQTEVTVGSFYERLHPEDRGLHQELLKHDPSGDALSYETELRVREDMGDWKWILTKGKVIEHDITGAPLRIVGMHQDITRRKAAEHAQSASEAQYRDIFNASADGLGVWRPDGTLVDANPAMYRMNGYESREAFLKASPHQYIHPDSYTLFDTFLAAIKHQKSFHGEGKNLAKDGHVIDVEVHGIPIQYQGSSHMLTIVRDIRERKQAEDQHRQLESQLRQAQKMEAIGHLTGGIAHDFNNILTSIMGYTVLGGERASRLKDEKIEKYFNQILRSGERARDLIQQMLTFSRGQRGEPRALALAPLIKEALKLLQSTLPSSVEIHTEIQTSVAAVRVDPVQIEQVLMNLCINARDAMDGCGSILIELKEQHYSDAICTACRQDFSGKFVELTVHDSGSGINPEIIERMFEPFFTTKEVGKGTGMGLSTVHGIVHEHGGHILVASRFGEGAEFRIVLPALAESETLEFLAANRDHNMVQARGTAARILVVDDEEAVAEFMGDLLESRGFKVVVKTDSLAARELFKQNPHAFDLVITDQTMPKLRGTELALALLQLRPTLPVILYSGHSEGTTEERVKKCGIRGFLKKPVETSALFELITELLAEKDSAETSPLDINHRQIHPVIH